MKIDARDVVIAVRLPLWLGLCIVAMQVAMLGVSYNGILEAREKTREFEERAAVLKAENDKLFRKLHGKSIAEFLAD